MKSRLLNLLTVSTLAATVSAQNAPLTAPPAQPSVNGVAAAPPHGVNSPTPEPAVVPGRRARTPPVAEAPAGGYGAVPSNYVPADSSTARYRTRLGGVVATTGSASSGTGSIIRFEARPQQELDELSEDLNVLAYIFSRNLERTFGEKTTEYRLGVPILMRSDSRMVEASYLHGFGVLVKVHVPFPLLPGGEKEDKPSAASADSEWENARQTLFGQGGDAESQGGAEGLAYDEKMVASLKKQMIDALKSAGNVRRLPREEYVTLAIFGGAVSKSKSAGEPPRNTIMVMRVNLGAARDAGKAGNGEDTFASAVQTTAYFDSGARRALPTAMGMAGSPYAR